MENHKIINILKFIGYLISVVHYASRFSTKSMSIAIGTILLVLGYSLLTIYSGLQIEKQDNKFDYFKVAGFIFLFLFFFGSFFFPITYTIQYYDYFAAIGYFLLLSAFSKNKYIALPDYGYFFMMLYYIGATYHIFGKTDVENVALFTGRSLLALAYLFLIIKY